MKVRKYNSFGINDSLNLINFTCDQKLWPPKYKMFLFKKQKNLAKNWIKKLLKKILLYLSRNFDLFFLNLWCKNYEESCLAYNYGISLKKQVMWITSKK